MLLKGEERGLNGVVDLIYQCYCYYLIALWCSMITWQDETKKKENLKEKREEIRKERKKQRNEKERGGKEGKERRVKEKMREIKKQRKIRTAGIAFFSFRK